MDGSCDTNEEEEESMQNFCGKAGEERMHIENLEEEQSLILK
jgi:hypothetical protein